MAMPIEVAFEPPAQVEPPAEPGLDLRVGAALALLGPIDQAVGALPRGPSTNDPAPVANREEATRELDQAMSAVRRMGPRGTEDDRTLAGRAAEPAMGPRDPELAQVVNFALTALRPIEELLSLLPGVIESPVSGLEDVDDAVVAARAYLERTALIGGTMLRQGPTLAIGRLHPEFALRLAAAIREARADPSICEQVTVRRHRVRVGKRWRTRVVKTRSSHVCLARAAVFSAYRPPAFGVGGFSDKFNSWHAYGMAVDMAGVGPAGSKAALLWHAIAGRHRLFNPYGPYHRAEFNHYQPTFTRGVGRGSPLRSTITGQGPISLDRMWQVAQSFMRNEPLAQTALAQRPRGKAKRVQMVSAHH